MILDRARARSGAPGALRLWICGLAAALAAALGGCSTNTNVSNGTPVVTVTTQAATGYSMYEVGITLYSLTRTDGYISYPAGYTAEEFADLTQRVDLTELLNAVGIPTGTYTSVVIGIDYSIPLIYLNGVSGAATVENTSGDNPGIVYVTVTLDPSHPLVVNLNQSTPFALDFDLAASNTVDVSTNTVIVRPFVEATATPADTEQVRARGLFVVAQTAQSNFIEDIRPFEDNVYSTVGALTVNTTPSTYFNIDGTVYTGAAGLAAMNNVASNTPVEAYGSLDGTPPGSSSTITPSYTATQVYVGTVVSNGEYEHVRGVVTGISGTNISVAGATYLYYEGYCESNLCYTYYPTATVSVGTSGATAVTEDGVVPATGSSFSTQSISVGSQIDAIGLGSTNSSNQLTLDAGLIRLQSTPVWGTLNSGTAGTAALYVLSMGNTVSFPANTFTFTGTGSVSANDANPANYEIDTSAATTGADQSATPGNTLLRVDGFPTGFGSAPPDFDATDVIPGSSEPADLIVEWGSASGTTAPFTSYDNTSLALNLANADLAEVVIGPQKTSLMGTPAITISGADQFAIGNATDGIKMYSTPSAFVSYLGTELNGSTTVYRVVAVGSYDAATNTFAASRLDIALE